MLPNSQDQEVISLIRFNRSATLMLLTLMLVSAVGFAQDEGAHGAEYGSGHTFEENTVAFFVGLAKEGSRDNGLALGIEYEHRLNQAFGIGALAEHTFGDLDAWVLAVPFAFHSGAWKFYVAPGIEDSVAGSESLLRLGGEYGFHRGDWEISPQLDVDFVDGNEIYVIGVTFGRGF